MGKLSLLIFHASLKMSLNRRKFQENQTIKNDRNHRPRETYSNNLETFISTANEQIGHHFASRIVAILIPRDAMTIQRWQLEFQNMD